MVTCESEHALVDSESRRLRVSGVRTTRTQREKERSGVGEVRYRTINVAGAATSVGIVGLDWDVSEWPPCAAWWGDGHSSRRFCRCAAIRRRSHRPHHWIRSSFRDPQPCAGWLGAPPRPIRSPAWQRGRRSSRRLPGPPGHGTTGRACWKTWTKLQ